jgi:hypothetical protein
LQLAALRDWLLDRPEAPELWADHPTLLSVAHRGRPGRPRSGLPGGAGPVGDNYVLTRTLGLLTAEEHVPYLPEQRYKPSGLRKRAQWDTPLATAPPGQRQIRAPDLGLVHQAATYMICHDHRLSSASA